jgi:EAL domain-containing protein (putative c-di-GMP-specific phosphodiesterase class I)/GGDEF domain-containing protein
MTVADEHEPESDGYARVVRAPTMIRQLDERCRTAWQQGGSAFPAGVCWILLDEVADHRDQIGFTGLEKLLHAIHERVRMQLDAQDLTARFGLDAIAVIMDSKGGERNFRADAEAILRSINGSLFEIGEHSIAATTSIAIRALQESMQPPEKNLVEAARAAERLSGLGGNRLELTANQTTSGEESPGTLLGQLTKALRDNTLKVVYQPLLATAGAEHERLQLLPRLIGADGQLIPAARFIPVAAERGVLPALDHWMIAHAVNLLRQRAERSAETPTLFLNQSPALLKDRKFFDWVATRVGELDEQHRGLVLEFSILELKPRIREARTILDRLQKLGIGVSLSGIDEKVPDTILLKHLPADYLRMKADFARRVLADEELAERFAAFSKTARKADRRVIVPMLEDAEEVSRIWQMDVDLIQGNFIQQPTEALAES